MGKDVINVFVSGSSGIVGYGIVRSLKESSLNCNVIGGSIYDISPSTVFSDKDLKVLPTNHHDYINSLINIIKDHNVDIIIPGIEIDVIVWNRYREELSNLANLGLNNKELIELCEDKWLFYNSLIKSSSNELAIKSVLPKEDYDYCKEELGEVFIVKARRGYGGKGFKVIKSFLDFNCVDFSSDDYLLQEYVCLESDNSLEYTVSVYGNGLGEFNSMISFERKLSKEGFSNFVEVVSNDLFKSDVLDLCRIFRPLGPTNFQFRRDSKGKLKLLEINPRISSTTSLKQKFGYNEAEMLINDLVLNQSIAQPRIRKGKAIRYAEDLMFYE